MNTLSKSLIAFIFSTAGLMSAQAQTANADEPKEPSARVRPVKGYYYTEIDGDSVKMIVLNDVYVFPPMVFKNKKEEEFYWRTVRDVRKTLPYAKLAFAALTETYEYIQTLPDKKTREKHLKRLEKDIVNQYKPVVKHMTKGQGKILLKLITRETDQNSYHIVKAFLGSLRASFYQAVGRFFGMNMKNGFNPAKNEEDAIIDRIATLIEQGSL